MNEDRIRERISELEGKVPYRWYGEGVLRFQAPADWRDFPADSEEAELLLEWAMLQNQLEANREFFDDLKVIIELAEEILATHGFPNGVPERVYWNEKNDTWREVKQNEECPLDEQLYLRKWWAQYVPRHSLLDLAIEMKLAADEADDCFFLIEDQLANGDFKDVPKTLNTLATSCFSLGRWYERAYWKQNHERAALKAEIFSQRQAERSKRGGQRNAEKAAARKQLFAKIAIDNLAKWLPKSGKSRTKAVMSIVLQNDPDQEFTHGGKPLTEDWFENSISELIQSGDIDRALKKKP